MSASQRSQRLEREFETIISNDDAVAFETLLNSIFEPPPIVFSFIIEKCAFRCFLVWLKTHEDQKDYWVDRPSEAGYNFLQWAVVHAKRDMVLSLLQMGADPNYVNPLDYSALNYVGVIYRDQLLYDMNSYMMNAQTKEARIACAWHLLEFGARKPRDINYLYPHLLINGIRHALASSRLAGRALVHAVRRVYGPVMRDLGPLLE